jgi:putative salt-induced outer membrane protein
MAAMLLPLLLLSADIVADGPPPVPQPIRAMLEAALASGNEGEIATIVKYARAADPGSADQVLAQATRWRADRDAKRRQVLSEASFLALWTGRAEAGGFITTGNSNTKGLTIAMNLTREGLRWRQKFAARADYQESLGITTREHYLASYEPNYKIADRAYAYGAAQYESDRFLGYRDRVSLSAGAGYSAIKSRAVKLDVELGPAYRDTAYTDDTVQRSIAARGTLDFAWKLSPGLSLSQAASAYVQHYNSSVTGTTALNAKLLGPLSAQISYNIQYESMPPVGSVSTDTTGRASLVYSF